MNRREKISSNICSVCSRPITFAAIKVQFGRIAREFGENTAKLLNPICQKCATNRIQFLRDQREEILLDSCDHSRASYKGKGLPDYLICPDCGEAVLVDVVVNALYDRLCCLVGFNDVVEMRRNGLAATLEG